MVILFCVWVIFQAYLCMFMHLCILLLTIMNMLSCLCNCREKEDDGDILDLVMSFSGLEEKVLQLYTFAKV